MRGRTTKSTAIGSTNEQSMMHAAAVEQLQPPTDGGTDRRGPTLMTSASVIRETETAKACFLLDHFGDPIVPITMAIGSSRHSTKSLAATGITTSSIMRRQGLPLDEIGSVPTQKHVIQPSRARLALKS